MKTLFLLRHSLTEANERRLYGGSTDSPLTEKGVAIAQSRRGAIDPCDLYATSGMLRANQTLLHMTGRAPDITLPELREMDFGAFEMRAYEELKRLPEYLHWIGDESGRVCCPGGECRQGFRARTLRGVERLLSLPFCTACLVCHGGVIVNLMEHWFPGEGRNFYQWQPRACGGYRVVFEDHQAVEYSDI